MLLENDGNAPNFSIELAQEASKQGRHSQLEAASEVTRAL